MNIHIEICFGRHFLSARKGGPKFLLGPLEKKLAKKSQDTPNFVHEIIIQYIVKCLQTNLLKNIENPGNITVLKNV